ncbi:AraC family transcriptional regulator [Prosthecochloris sp.]|uniref:AraC family transcriptional regulator n=1 Tax=Prosthecochloris sp. TaxID=290513 RepID=UPI0025D9C674|nr:AraC family transcriptional regulator [Prosthecochloris sp.]
MPEYKRQRIQRTKHANKHQGNGKPHISNTTHKENKQLYLRETFYRKRTHTKHYTDWDLQQIELHSDFWISLLTGPPDRNMTISYHKKPSLIDFGFILSGCLKHRLHGNGTERIEGSSGLSGIGFFPDRKGIVEISGSQPIQVMHIHISPKRLYEMVCDDLDAMPPTFRNVLTEHSDDCYLSKGVIAPLTWSIALDIFNDGFQGLPKKLFLECKALELLTLRLGHLMTENEKCHSRNGLSLNEKERIRAAREWLIRDLSAPPSLRDLENRFCLNRNKLQAGFHDLFGNSVFGHLREHKMQKALFLLGKADMNVSQVAWSVGYENVSQFTKAFKKRFGILPRHHRQLSLNK